MSSAESFQGRMTEQTRRASQCPERPIAVSRHAQGRHLDSLITNAFRLTKIIY